jgi:hypothetical protein
VRALHLFYTVGEGQKFVPGKAKVSRAEHDFWVLVSTWSPINMAMDLYEKLQRIRNNDCLFGRSPVMARSITAVTCTHCRERQENGVG